MRFALAFLLLCSFFVTSESIAANPSPEGQWRCERGCGCSPSSESKATSISKAPAINIIVGVQVTRIGPVPDLVLVNECGQTSGAVQRPDGRIQSILWRAVGEISSSGTTITWSNGSVWVKRAAHPEVKTMLQYWEGKTFKCSDRRVPLVPPFPSKEPENAATEYCDDGDAIMENALLCYAGDKRGCDTVRDSQSADGRWWRSPRKAVLQPGEPLLAEKGQTTLSNDHALGVMLYLSVTNDRNAFHRWVHWIDANDRCRTFCGISPPLTARFCEHDNCTLKLNDCPLLEILGAQLGEPVPFCGKFVPTGPPIALITKQLNESYDTLISEFPVVPPAAKELKKLLDQAVENLNATAYSVEQLRSKLDQLLVAKARLAGIITNINKTMNAKGFSRHNTMVEVMMLEEWGFGSKELNDAVATVMDRVEGGKKEGDNPYFEYVAHRSSERMIELALQKCPPIMAVDNHPRTQWMWERAADDADAPGKSMFWDCIFIGELWQNGDVMDPKVADMNEQEEAARLAFEQTMKAFNAVKDLTNILLQQLQKGMRDPSSIDWDQFRQFAEERRQQAEVLARDLDTLRQKITNNLPGADLFDLSRLPNPIDRIPHW